MVDGTKNQTFPISDHVMLTLYHLPGQQFLACFLNTSARIPGISYFNIFDIGLNMLDVRLGWEGHLSNVLVSILFN